MIAFLISENLHAQKMLGQGSCCAPAASRSLETLVVAITSYCFLLSWCWQFGVMLLLLETVGSAQPACAGWGLGWSWLPELSLSGAPLDPEHRRRQRHHRQAPRKVKCVWSCRRTPWKMCPGDIQLEAIRQSQRTGTVKMHSNTLLKPCSCFLSLILPYS